MDQTLSKKELIRVARAIRGGSRISAGIVGPFLAHEFRETSGLSRIMLRIAAGLSLFFASVLVIFPEVGEMLIEVLPGFFQLPERVSRALDYVWGLVGKPVKKDHLMYHLPNIIIYAFGVAGIRQLWRRIHKNNWKDRVEASQDMLGRMIAEGRARFRFDPGFSVLFVGEGDRIAKSLVLDDATVGPTVSSRRQPYTDLWGKFVAAEGDEGFEKVLSQFNTEDAGEFVLFPVVDEHLFLPGAADYDIPPHRVEIAVRRIRRFESDNEWMPKRIVIVGDKEQESRFVTVSDRAETKAEADDISLRTISDTYENVIVADPTDITLAKIIEFADGRRIYFRASDRGAEKYGNEFYRRLSILGYQPSKEAVLTVGYDISDLETEHQVVAHQRAEYLPVILSRDVFDLLSREYLKEGPYIFVPHLVKQEVQKLIA